MRKFTPKEIQVMSLLATGQKTREIADALHSEKRTVDFHIRNIYTKLNVRNRVEAVLAWQRLSG